ncbi:MAG: lysylphosphatidylglycerol synthase transmembrane domain-containing protein [Bacteroidota bacterium]
MEENSSKVLRKIRPTKIILPILFGFAGISLVMYFDDNFSFKSFSLISFGAYFFLFVFISFLMMACRDIGYMIRLRILTDKQLNWRKTFNIIMLWEFTSAVTPGAIGGTSVATVFIHKEGLSVGKSTAVVMATSLLDELYFIIMFPLVFLTISPVILFSIGGSTDISMSFDYSNKYFLFAIIAYTIKFIWILFIGYGLFKNPKMIAKFINFVFKLRFLKKWKNGADKAGKDVITASKELKQKSFVFWLKAFGATFFSWTARYWVLNFLLIALIFSVSDNLSCTIPDFGQNILIFARQLVMWIMMVIFPTPGGSGIVELVFSDYLAEFIPVAGLVAVMAILWRLVSYYPYLFIGVFVLPKWIRRVFPKK